MKLSNREREGVKGSRATLNFEKSARRAEREDAGSGESGSCLLKYKTRNDTAWRINLHFCSQGLLNDKKVQWGEVRRGEGRRTPVWEPGVCEALPASAMSSCRS